MKWRAYKITPGMKPRPQETLAEEMPLIPPKIVALTVAGTPPMNAPASVPRSAADSFNLMVTGVCLGETENFR